MKYTLALILILLGSPAWAINTCNQDSAQGRWWVTMNFAKDNVNCSMTCERIVIDEQGHMAPNAFCRLVMSQYDGYPEIVETLSTTGRLWMNLATPEPGKINQDRQYCDRQTDGFGEEFCLDNGLCFHINVMQDHDWQKTKRDANGEVIRQGRGVNPGSHMQGMVRVNNGAVGHITMMRRSMGPNQID